MKYRYAKVEFQKLLNRMKALENKESLTGSELERLYADVESLVRQFFPPGINASDHHHIRSTKNLKVHDRKKGYSEFYKIRNLIDQVKSIITDLDVKHNTHDWTQQELDRVVNRLLPLLKGTSTINELLATDLYQEFDFLNKGSNGKVLNTERLIEYIDSKKLIEYGSRQLRTRGNTAIELPSDHGRKVLEKGGWLVKLARDRKDLESSARRQLFPQEVEDLLGTPDHDDEPSPDDLAMEQIGILNTEAEEERIKQKSEALKAIQKPQVWTEKEYNVTIDAVLNYLEFGKVFSITQLLSNELYSYVSFLPKNKNGEVSVSDFIMYMLKAGLIEKTDKTFEQLSDFGLEVKRSGGWLFYLADKEGNSSGVAQVIDLYGGSVDDKSEVKPHPTSVLTEPVLSPAELIGRVRANKIERQFEAPTSKPKKEVPTIELTKGYFKRFGSWIAVRFREGADEAGKDFFKFLLYSLGAFVIYSLISYSMDLEFNPMGWVLKQLDMSSTGTQ